MNKILLSTLLITMLSTPIAWAKNHQKEYKQETKITYVQTNIRVVPKLIPRHKIKIQPVHHKYQHAKKLHNRRYAHTVVRSHHKR